MKTAIIIFPGSNCDNEMERFLYKSTGIRPMMVWHKESVLPDVDLYVLPGGFSYGDYLRVGALANLSPVMEEIKRVAKEGRKILGICNGFQILCEAKLLPGTLRINRTQNFICKPVCINDVHGKSYTIPIAHAEGNYFYPPSIINVAYTYTVDVNGSMGNIAGVYNSRRNILGMMPHPERAFESYHCSQDGFKIFDDFLGVRPGATLAPH
jgi:phosphoribosylformylglycinamidine synthase